MKLLNISYNLFAGTEMLSLSVYEPIAIQILIGGPYPDFGEGVKLGVRVWYHVKAHHKGHNLSIETETLYLCPFTSQSQYKFCLGGPSPNLAEGSS